MRVVTVAFKGRSLDNYIILQVPLVFSVIFYLTRLFHIGSYVTFSVHRFQWIDALVYEIKYLRTWFYFAIKMINK